jgi:DNA-binding NarL/FixJ family response regulator
VPRIKGRQYRQAAPQRASDRQTQVREHLAQGVSDPSVIGKALGVSREAVIYHAKNMADVALEYDRTNRRRVSLRLIATEAAA